jgi:hypothetical protein
MKTNNALITWAEALVRIINPYSLRRHNHCKPSLIIFNTRWPLKGLMVFTSLLLLSQTNFGQSISVLNRTDEFTCQDSEGNNTTGCSGSGLPWFVVSDRNDNKLYLKADTTSQEKVRIINGIQIPRIKFNDVLYVLEISPDKRFIKVAPVKYNKTELFQNHVISNKVIAQANDVSLVNSLSGWIPIDKVVKYLYCQRQGTNFNNVREQWLRKGFIAATAAQVGQLQIYKTPDFTPGVDGEPAGTAQYYFVYKVDIVRNAFLVGLFDNLNKNHSENLIGWVPGSIFTIWPNNMAYEPNWDLIARDEFRRHGTLPYFYITNDKSKLKDDPTPGVIPDTIENNGRRMDKYRQRLFLLEFADQPWKRIGKVTDPSYRNSAGQLVYMEESEYSILKERVASALETYKKVNIIFAIDGTNSIESYWPEIIKGIQNASESVSKRAADLKFVFNYSILFYRDGAPNLTYPIKGAPYTFSGFKTEINQLSSFINQQIAFDPDPPGEDWEGLFVGLNHLFTLNTNDRLFSKYNANFLFVIGDAGNRIPTVTPTWNSNWDIDKAVIAKKLAQYFFNVIGIQARRPLSKHSAYEAFGSQLRYIVQEVATMKFPEENWNDLFIEGVNDFRIKPELPEFGCSGVIWLKPDQSLPSNTITKMITTSLTNISNDIWEKEIFNLYEKLYDDPRYKYNITFAGQKPAFRNIVRSVTRGDATVTQFVEKGYLKKEHPNINNPMFYDVTMLSTTPNIVTLRTALQLLTPATIVDEAQTRTAMHTNWINVLTNVLKLYNVSSVNAMNKLTLGELSNILTGTPGPSQFSAYHLEDIEGVTKMPSKEFYSYLGSFLLTKYCVSILDQNDPNRPNNNAMFFRDEANKRLLRDFIKNAINTPDCTAIDFPLCKTPQCIKDCCLSRKVDKVVLVLHQKLNNSFFNLDYTKFDLPISPGSGQNKYEWVDCRIFANDITFKKFIELITSIIN